MSTTHLIQTAFEIIVAVTIIVGFIFEPSIAEWEQNLLKKLKGGKSHEADYF